MAEAARRARRLPALIAAGVVLGAAAMAAAAGLTWWSQPFDDSLTGRVDAVASGAATLPELVPVALVALAGFGATLATRGVARRVVGGLLLLAGVLVAVRAVGALWTPPAALVGGLVRPATAAAPPTGHPWGPLLAAAGASAVMVAGTVVLLGRGSGGRRAIGARYERRRPTVAGPEGAPGRGTAVSPPLVPSTAPAAGAAGADPVAGAGEPEARTVDWWNQLDSGTDPTADPGPGRMSPGGAPSPGRATTEPGGSDRESPKREVD